MTCTIFRESFFETTAATILLRAVLSSARKLFVAAPACSFSRSGHGRSRVWFSLLRACMVSYRLFFCIPFLSFGLFCCWLLKPYHTMTFTTTGTSIGTTETTMAFDEYTANSTEASYSVDFPAATTQPRGTPMGQWFSCCFPKQETTTNNHKNRSMDNLTPSKKGELGKLVMARLVTVKEEMIPFSHLKYHSSFLLLYSSLFITTYRIRGRSHGSIGNDVF